MEEEKVYYVETILPVPVSTYYTYYLPEEFVDIVSIGSRVIVQFGARRILTGIVTKVHQTPPANYKTKQVLDVLDETPLIFEKQIRFIQWMAEYYMCSIGEVLNAALPSGLKLASHSKFQINPHYIDLPEIEFSEAELHLLEILKRKDSLSYDEVAQFSTIKKVHLVIKSLLKKNKILLYEEVREKYTPQYVQKIRLNDKYASSEENIKTLFEALEKKPKQQEVVIKYLQNIPLATLEDTNQKGLEKNILIGSTVSESSLNTLIKNKIFEQFSEIVPRYTISSDAGNTVSLSEDQQRAASEIKSEFQHKEVVLLHGITGSGKTEVYIKLIQEAIAGGSQILYMLPEIALTSQIVVRLQKVFGNSMGVYHSKFSDNERVDVWKGVATGKLSFIVGVRSSIFLPFHNLGIIIVDEEHESSYKQYEPAPRYHARDSAILLASIHYSKTLLGSATPSVESFFLASSGKYGIVNMKSRFGQAQLPQLELVDMKIERRNKTLRNDFSKVLYDEIVANKQKGRQTILFQNRRGYAPTLACEECAHVFKCDNCSVSLTYHLSKKEISCHYCGHREKLPHHCPECKSTKIRTQGYGTEKIEEDVRLFFPEMATERMDLDTTRKKNSFRDIIRNFESNKTDILIGTQMVSKGFDFGNVALVGIMDVDRFLHFPDFRSYEKTFQIITQVSGRAGRRETKGKVIIQTSNPQHLVFDKILKNDYQGFYDVEIAEREKFLYPPFSRLIKIIVKDPVEETAHNLAILLASHLKKELGDKRVLGPEAAIIFRLRNNFLFEIHVKIERGKVNLQMVKELILKHIDTVLDNREYIKSRVLLDVDPV